MKEGKTREGHSESIRVINTRATGCSGNLAKVKEENNKNERGARNKREKVKTTSEQCQRHYIANLRKFFTGVHGLRRDGHGEKATQTRSVKVNSPSSGEKGKWPEVGGRRIREINTRKALNIMGPPTNRDKGPTRRHQTPEGGAGERDR